MRFNTAYVAHKQNSPLNEQEVYQWVTQGKNWQGEDAPEGLYDLVVFEIRGPFIRLNMYEKGS